MSLLDISCQLALGTFGFHPLGPQFVFKLSADDAGDRNHFNVIQGRCKVINPRSQHEPLPKKMYQPGLSSYGLTCRGEVQSAMTQRLQAELENTDDAVQRG